MKYLKANISWSQIQAILRKDFLVRWRQKWLMGLQLLWPLVIFLLPYLIRLKFTPIHKDSCQFPTRQLPTVHQTLPGMLSYLCTLENKCKSTDVYDEYEYLPKSPVKPIIDIVQIFINDEGLFKILVELPQKANFISAVTTLVTNSHFGEIRANIEKVVDMIPEVEKALNGTFDIKQLFSNRQTFVKAGNLICGYPFPSIDTIPLVSDILESQDFSKANDDEINSMPTPYCKKLYLDVTRSNYGKITWESVKPIIQGKILFAPNNEDTNSIMSLSNSTFHEINRLKMLSVAIEQILLKLKAPGEFQEGFDSLLDLARTPFVRGIIGDEIDLDQVEAVIHRIRTDPVVEDVITTVRKLLECFSVDRFIPFDTEDELRHHAFEMNQKKMFYAAIYFNDTKSDNVAYKLHMDTQNTQPTIENRNRFWFPGPSGSMLLDLKYHRGFVQIKHSLDLGIIRHKKDKLRELGILKPPATPRPPRPLFTVQIDTGDEDEEDDDDEWFTNSNSTTGPVSATKPKNQTLISSVVSGLGIDVGNVTDKPTAEETTMTLNDDSMSESSTDLPKQDVSSETTTNLPLDTTTEPMDSEDETTLFPNELPDSLLDTREILSRQKRQGLADLFSSFSNQIEETNKYDIDKLKYFTKQFPYPAYTRDDFKTGIYLAQAIQLAFFIGLVAEIASSVRHLIWMRESKNSMIMRAMGLKSCSEMTSWCLVTFLELLAIFIMVSIVLYTGGMVVYTKWIFTMIYLCAFGVCLISFCFMCSTFFVTATIGAVATTVLFFISFCPYIIVLIFDSKLNSLQNFLINLSFTTAYSHGWSHIMRMELQEIGLSFDAVFREGLRGEYGFAFFMIILDTIIYGVVGYVHQRFKDDDNRFVEVQREELDSSVGATLTNVTKIYNETKYAVTDISLSFPRNKVTCLLGRNGAGKSTIIKMLTGQVVQSTGRVILAHSMSNSKEYDKVGVCAQDNILIPNLTAREHLELYAKIKLKRNYEGEVQKTLRDLNFGKHENYQASQLSGGYKRRLCVAISFIASPNVVILDEPCNGVDNKARKDIWDLIERLRIGRAVIFATHFLDEAEYLSDVIVIMKNGKIIAKHNPETLKNHCTSFYEVSMNSCDSQTSDMVVDKANKLLTNFRQLDKTSPTDLSLRISYDQQNYNSSEYLEYLQELQGDGRIKDLCIESENLEHVFKNLDKHVNGTTQNNGHIAPTDSMKNVKLKRELGWDMVNERTLNKCTAIRQLFWKRLVHFSRNYRMLLCVIVLPALFEICAMWFVAQRLEDDFDKTINLSRQLYPKTTQLLSMEKPLTFTQEVYDNMKQDCSGGADLSCKEFPNTEKSFYWVLKTLNDYQEKRYGGFTFNDTKSMVWYNNKGYHAMLAWLNDMNSYLMQVEMNDTNFKITSYNEPWELGFLELSTTSILRQAGDSCLAFILLIAFSMIVAVASVYLVNERVKGEKLQQRLCGVDSVTYWAVAFIWDFLILILGIMVCSSVILAFDMPVFTDLQQLWGVIVLALFFGFACIPAVHVFEKCFNDSSVAIVGIFIINVIIPLFTLSTVVLLGVVGDSPAWDDWRHFLNHRLFIIFPQHALGDGLLELCKNYMVSLTFRRYGIDSYKNPINSDLLQVHFTSLTIVGIFFLVLNVLLESGLLGDWKEKLMERFSFLGSQKHKHTEELKVISIQNSLKRTDKNEMFALKVDNLSKSYGKSRQYAVSNVTFAVKSGECFGLLGKNGAGKSTIFKMLSGQLRPSDGHIVYENPEISYCPQTNTLDDLLTVRECIEFYGKLRRINDLPKLVTGILESFQLESYRDVLVKNLSGGNRRKLTVATSCCGRTSVVLMDEPTSDMDPVTRAIVYRTIDDLLAEKRAIVLTSHSISEIDQICHRIAVLKDGQMLTCSSPESLKAQFGGYYNVTVYCDQNKMNDLEKEIRRQFPYGKDLQLYAHSIKFSIKIENPNNINGKKKENGIDLPEELKKAENDALIKSTSTKESLTLSQLFHDLNTLPQQVSSSVRYAVNRCKLDVVFERILDKSEQNNLKKGSFNNIGDVAAIGSPSTGYIHTCYVETET